MKNKYTIDGDTASVLIESDTYGKMKILMDAEDIAKIPQKIGIVTYLDDKNIIFGTYIKRADGSRERVLLVRHLLGVTDREVVVTKKNDDCFDLRKSNLETIEANRYNSTKPTRKNTTGVRGIRYNHRMKNRPWNAIFSRNSKSILDAHFATKEEAIDALNKARAAHGAPPVEVF